MDRVWIFNGFSDQTEQEAVITLSKKVANSLIGKDVLIDIICFYNNKTKVDFNWDKLAAVGVKTFYSCENDVFDGYHYSAYVTQLEKLIRQYKPRILLFHSTKLNRIISTYIQTLFHVGLTAECSDFTIKNDLTLIQVRPTYEKSKYAHIITESDLQIANIMFQKFDNDLNMVKNTNGQQQVVVQDLTYEDVSTEHIRYKVLEHSIHAEKKENNVILSGGMGLKSKENYEMLRNLSEKLKIRVGATRPLVEMGWAKKSELIGISGSFVTSQIYVAFGISGSIQHLGGLNCKKIISINPDKNAPINKISNYVILRDASEILKVMVRLCNHIE